MSSCFIFRLGQEYLERDEVVVLEYLDLLSRLTDGDVLCCEWVDGECL